MGVFWWYLGGIWGMFEGILVFFGGNLGYFGVFLLYRGILRVFEGILEYVWYISGYFGCCFCRVLGMFECIWSNLRVQIGVFWGILFVRKWG